jgi:hypothetical protein
MCLPRPRDCRYLITDGLYWQVVGQQETEGESLGSSARGSPYDAQERSSSHRHSLCEYEFEPFSPMHYINTQLREAQRPSAWVYEPRLQEMTAIYIQCSKRTTRHYFEYLPFLR